MQDWINIGMLLITIFAAGFAWWSAKKTSESAEIARQAVIVTGLKEFALGEYANRECSIEINDQQIHKLKNAQHHALTELRANRKQWEENSKKSSKDTWQNQTAYETAISLERLGLVALTGLVPLGVVLAIFGDQIIDDWLVCRHWVKSYREEENFTSNAVHNNNSVPYHRRHGEWLVLLTLLWVKNKSLSFKNYEELLTDYGGEKKIEQLLVQYSRNDAELMPKNAWRDIKLLTGVHI